MKNSDDIRADVKEYAFGKWNRNLTEDQITSCIKFMEKKKLSVFHGHIWPSVRKVDGKEIETSE